MLIIIWPFPWFYSRDVLQNIYSCFWLTSTKFSRKCLDSNQENKYLKSYYIWIIYNHIYLLTLYFPQKSLTKNAFLSSVYNFAINGNPSWPPHFSVYFTIEYYNTLSWRSSRSTGSLHLGIVPILKKYHNLFSMLKGLE